MPDGAVLLGAVDHHAITCLLAKINARGGDSVFVCRAKEVRNHIESFLSFLWSRRGCFRG